MTGQQNQMLKTKFKLKVLPGAFYGSVVDMFNQRGYIVNGNSDFDAIVWTGGNDINPKWYGENAIPGTYGSERQDRHDLEVYASVSHTLPKIGICRGAQFLSVQAGGKMWQDTDRHQQAHKATDVATGRVLTVSSIHHQMMRPSPSATILLTADQSSYVQSEGELRKKSAKPYKDVEAVYCPENHSLCYQGHPEIDKPEGVDYFFHLLHEFLGL